MLRNYIKIGVRNLLKNSLFSLINISGMAISIATFLVITLFVVDELSYDRHVPEVDLKYRVFTDMHNDDDGSVRKLAMVPPAIAPAMEAEMPEVDYTARFMNFNNGVLFEAGEKKLTESRGGYADPTIIPMLGLRLVEGDEATALKEPGKVAISKTLAGKYYDGQPALGQPLQISNRDFVIDAVFEDFPVHSHLQRDFFISLETFATGSERDRDRLQNWGWSQFHTYVKLKPGSDGATAETKLKDLIKRHTSGEDGENYVPHLMPVRDVHLYTYDHMFEIAVRGSIQTVYILAVTAMFMLVIAILNFINLSTARAINRVKEVGVRKVMGAVRLQLIKQFISESLIVTLVALLIAVGVTELLLPFLNSFAEKSIPTGIMMNPAIVVGLLAGAAVIGLAAGTYPAFVISAHQPSDMLSNKQSGGGRALLRKGLVLLQFMLSFFLITASLIVTDQHSFLRTRDMGFNKDNLIVISMRGDMRKDIQVTKDAFLGNPNIISATMGYGLPGQAYAGDGIFDKVAKENRGMSMLTVDNDYIKTLGLTLIAGRDFSMDSPADLRSGFIVSETAAKTLGYTDAAEALGHEVSWERWDNPDSLKEGKVIGVVKDVHLNSLRESISPVIIHMFPFAYNTMTLRISGDDIPSTIAHLESTWKRFNEEWPFEYKFLDDNFDKLYKSEQKLATLFSFFTGFTIFVACLGLFGLVVYNTTQRYKEISIRKVLGASEVGLVVQLGKSYFFLVAVAFLIAAPVSYYAASQWLQKFAYRVEITPWLFVKSALFILVISLLTVGIQSFKAARSNPVNALKEQ